TELWSPAPRASPVSFGHAAPGPERPADTSTFAWPQALHEIPRGLANTYYRGNDERSDKLFNGGKYRTCTFFVSIRSEDDQELQPGSVVGSGPIHLRCHILRAPNTASGFFTKDRMAGVRLIRASGIDPKDPPIPLFTLREDWEWEVRAPLGKPAGGGYQ